jgi:hypothetical protein
MPLSYLAGAVREAHGENYQAVVKLASIRIWLRVNQSPT